MAVGAGKVALVASTNLLSGTNPVHQVTVVDFVGYGSSANGYEGFGAATGPSDNNKQGILRKKGGLSDTDDNSADFVVGTPDPHNRDSPPLLRAGDIAIIGWDDTEDLFSFVALSTISAGTAIHFTDNGWSNTQYRTGEDVIRWLANTDIPAGTIIRSDATSNIFTWVRSGGYTNLSLSTSGDQIYAFQGPLVDPTTNLFVLDDTGCFEPAHDPSTGDVPPGLVLNRTAITFSQKKDVPHFMAFTNFPDLAKTKVQWLMAIADSNNWQFGELGTLPSGPLTVNPPPALTLLASPEKGGVLTGAGLWDEGATVTITAAPAAGYVFIRWSDGNRNAVRTIAMPRNDVTNTSYFASTATLLFLH